MLFNVGVGMSHQKSLNPVGVSPMAAKDAATRAERISTIQNIFLELRSR